MTTVTINQVNDNGEIVNKIDCTVLKVIKDTPTNFSFVGMTGFLDVELVKAEKQFDDAGNVSYNVRNNISLNFVNFIDIDNNDS